MECREACGACCISPSISSPIPGMPNGKPAGTVCIHLDEELKCKLFHCDSRPKVCGDFIPTMDACGENREQALFNLSLYEELTAP